MVRLIAQHKLTRAQIAKVAGVSRKSVFNYCDQVERGGVAKLLTREWAGGPDSGGACGGGQRIYRADGGWEVPPEEGRAGVDQEANPPGNKCERDA